MYFPGMTSSESAGDVPDPGRIGVAEIRVTRFK